MHNLSTCCAPTRGSVAACECRQAQKESVPLEAVNEQHDDPRQLTVENHSNVFFEEHTHDEVCNRTFSTASNTESWVLTVNRADVEDPDSACKPVKSSTRLECSNWTYQRRSLHCSVIANW